MGLNDESKQSNKVLRTDLEKMRNFPDGTSADEIPKREYTYEEWEVESKRIEEINKKQQKIATKEAADEWMPPISIEELCKKEFPAMQWVVENMFARKTINQVSAQPNQGKTWVVLHMAICIAKGEKVFDKFNTEKQGVMIVNEEDPEELLQDRFKMLLDEPSGIPIYLHIENGIMLEDETVDTLIQEMKDNHCGTIIFDSLSVIHDADENSSTEMNVVFRQMKRFTREGFTVIFTNHHRKKSRGGFKDDPQEQTRGSTVINAVPAGHITCEERKSGDDVSIIIRQVKLKSAKKLNPFIVQVKESDSKRIFTYGDEYIEDVDSATKLRQELYDILKGSDIWLGIADFLRHTGRTSDKPIREQLKSLVATGQIQRETRANLIKRGDPVSESDKSKIMYFRITPLYAPEEEAT